MNILRYLDGEQIEIKPIDYAAFVLICLGIVYLCRWAFIIAWALEAVE